MRQSKALTIIRNKGKGSLAPGVYTNSEKAYREYLDTLSPRVNPHIRAALATAEDHRFLLFLQRIDSHKYSKTSLATIAQGCKITLREFNDWYQKAANQRAIALAQMSTPNIVEDMTIDARSKDEFCERCDGQGWVPAQPGLPDDMHPQGYKCLDANPEDPKYIRTCPKCLGKATVRRPGDAHARDKVMEMSGLIKKGALVNINQNFAGQHGAALKDLDDVMTLDLTADD